MPVDTTPVELVSTRPALSFDLAEHNEVFEANLEGHISAFLLCLII